MPLDREKAREAIKAYDTGEVASLHPGHPDDWLDDLLDALEACVTPRLAEVDVRIVGEAEARLARVVTLLDEMADSMDPEVWPYATRLRTILDAPS